MYECLYEVGSFEQILALTQRVVDKGIVPEEVYLYRARAYAAQGSIDQERAAYESALVVRPGWQPAKEGLEALPD